MERRRLCMAGIVIASTVTQLRAFGWCAEFRAPAKRNRLQVATKHAIRVATNRIHQARVVAFAFLQVALDAELRIARPSLGNLQMI